MYEKEPRPPEARFSFEEIVTYFDECDQASMPYHQAAFLLSAAERPQNRVENGILISHSGSTFKLATEEELNALREVKDKAEESLMDKLGLEDPSLLPAVNHVVDSIKTKQMRKEKGISRWEDEILSGLGLRRLTVPELFKAAKFMSELTGESYRVWINMYHTKETEISADTDIDPLIEEGMEIDKQMVSHMRANPLLSKDFKEQFTVENVYEAYGINSVASES